MKNIDQITRLIREYWDTSGLITAQSYAEDEYKIYQMMVEQDGTGDFEELQLTLLDFQKYIEYLGENQNEEVEQ